MAGKLVLLTGGTGHIGFRTLVETLRAGYRVRAAVRRESAKADITATKSIQPYLSNLSFVIVEDITKDGAFDEAVQGVDYIIHLASPLAKPSDDLQATIIEPAVRGTLSVLYSALTQPTIKKVVITASVASVMPPQAYAPGWEGVVTSDTRLPDPSGPYSNYFQAYAASKILAYNRTLDFIEKENPKFSIVNVMPVFVVGKNELATTPAAVNSGSNSLVLINILGGTDKVGRTANTVSVDDVAVVHVRSLEPQIKGNQNFLLNSEGLKGAVWDDALAIVKKHFPKQVESGLLPNNGHVNSVQRSVDAQKAEETFNLKFKSFEDQVVDLVSWYVEVSGQA